MIRPVYSWLYDLLKQMMKHQKLGVDVINLVGSRSSGKTVAALEFACNACDLVDKDGEPITASVYVLRKQQISIDEVGSQYLQGIETIQTDPTIYKAERRWEFNNGSSIKFKYLTTKDGRTANAGMASATGEYIIVIYEEAFEYTDRERSLFDQAVRGSRKDAKYLEINICNPGYPNSNFLKKCIKYAPFNEEQLLRTGYQATIVDIPQKSGRIERNLFFYTNWRAIRDVLPDRKIDQILKVYDDDPQNAKCVDIGVPGFQSGSVYADLMENIQEPQGYAHRYVVGGGDVGVGHTQKSGKTAFVFCAIDPDSFIDVYDEYVGDNKHINKDGYVLAEEIIQFYIRNYQNYIQNTGVIPEQVVVKVDNSEQAFIDILNNRAIEFGVDNGLNFVPCSKYQINDRIHITRYIMSNQRLRISRQCENLIDELSISRGDAKASAKLKREDDNDHSINAFEYAIEDFMYDFIAARDAETLGKKISKAGRRKIYL